MRAGAFGDIIMGTSILPHIRAAFPKAHLTWIAEHTEFQAIEANPYIDEVIRWDGAYFKRPLRSGNLVAWGLRLRHAYAQFRIRNYDTFISFQPEEWPLLLRAVSAKLKIGVFDTFRRYYRAEKTSPNVRYYDFAYTYPNLPDHRIDQYLLVLDALGINRVPNKHMTIGYTADDLTAARHCLADFGLSGRRFLAVVTQTTWPTKSWGRDRYIELCRSAYRDLGLPIVLLGGPKEIDQIQSMAHELSDIEAFPCAGTLSFRESAALIHQAAAIVSGDTGPMHVASALGTPQVAIFGATSAKWYGPISPKAFSLQKPVPCGPCDQKYCPNPDDRRLDCMKQISVSEVLHYLSRVIDGKSADEPAARLIGSGSNRAPKGNAE